MSAARHTGGRPPAKTAKRSVAARTVASRAASDAPAFRTRNPSTAATSATCRPEIATMCATPPSRKAPTTAHGEVLRLPEDEREEEGESRAVRLRRAGEIRAQAPLERGARRVHGREGTRRPGQPFDLERALHEEMGLVGQLERRAARPPALGQAQRPRHAHEVPGLDAPARDPSPRPRRAPRARRARAALRRRTRTRRRSASSRASPPGDHGASRRPVISTRAPPASAIADERRRQDSPGLVGRPGGGREPAHARGRVAEARGEDEAAESRERAAAARGGDGRSGREEERGAGGGRRRHGERGGGHDAGRDRKRGGQRRRARPGRPRAPHAALLSDRTRGEQGHRLDVVGLREEVEKSQSRHGVPRLQGREVARERRRVAGDHEDARRARAAGSPCAPRATGPLAGGSARRRETGRADFCEWKKDSAEARAALASGRPSACQD